MKKALVIGFVSVIVLVAAACASNNSGQAAVHRHYPTHAGEVEKVVSGVGRVGHGTIEPFVWSVYVEHGRPGGPPCFDVRVTGPLREFPGGKRGGPGQSETRCGLGASRHGEVVTVPIKEGDSWPPFNIGIAAYKTPVSRVRLALFEGGREEFHTRRLHHDFGIRGIGSVRYAVFAVEGCATKVQGLEKKRVVATASDWECKVK